MPRRDVVNLEEITDWMLAEIERIDESDAEQKRKTRDHQRLAKKVMTKLTDDRRLKDDQRLAPATLRRYLSIVRAAVTAKNWRHHALEQTVDRMARRFPAYADSLHGLLDLDDISELRVAHRALANEIRQAGDGVAYQEVAGMRLDHEIMRHLTLPEIHKATLSHQHVESLEHRATHTVQLRYAEIIEKIGQMMRRRQPGDGGTFVPVRSHMALALALATGRRSWEVLVTGRFKKVGEFELEFSGQAKKRGGVDYGETYRIYSLVSADDVLEGLEALRAMPDVVGLQGLDNLEFNARTASGLNRAAREWLGEDRVFKDTRAIWARCVFDLHFRVDKRWRKSNETVFWREQLGHEDMDTQESYKQFKIDYSTAPAEQQAKGPASRIEALELLDDNDVIQKRAALSRIHEWVKSQIREFPEAPITQSLISRELGSGRPMIKDYLEIAQAALETENRDSEVKAYQPPSELQNEAAAGGAKPRLNVHRGKDGEFEAVATINGVVVATATAADRMEAMRQAYEAARES
ncbi:MAG: protelomerase family protein [Pseudomonadota bacterium]|nr:protelomerase family protein [Pseudomonadota bacterium]